MNKKTELRNTIMNFLRLRRRAFIEIHDHSHRILTEQLIIKFNLIQNYDYWRHCREVCIQWEMIMQIMPSPLGHHAAIRDRMTGLINEWSLIGGTPKQEYEKSNRGQTFSSSR